MFIFTATRCLKFSRNVICFPKFYNAGLPGTHFFNNSFVLNGTTNYRRISDSRKESISSINDDFTEALISFKYLRLIKKAIREFGPFVEENEKLASLLERAKKLNMPNGCIDFVKRISIENKARAGLFEVLFVGNCHLIIQYEDIDLSPTKPHVLKLCYANDAHMVIGNPKWPLHFEQKGLLSVKSDSTNSLFNDLNEAKVVASKIGAQTVQSEFDPEGVPYWKFYCDPGDLHEVKRQLANEGCEIEETYVGYIPKHKVVFSNSVRNIVRSMIVELNKLPTIDNVFTNIL